jgi:hypothetical protein
MAPTNRARKLDCEVVGPHVKSATLLRPLASYFIENAAAAMLDRGP